jgi:hypothetical protein
LIDSTCQAGKARVARRPVGEHHELADPPSIDPLADRFDVAGTLMAQQEGELVSQVAVHIVHVAVADSAGRDPHEYFPRPRTLAPELLDPEGPASGFGHHTTPDYRTHSFSLP